MIDVRAHLARKPLLFDGGMGTYYKAKPGTECEQGNLLDPAGVRKVHREYLAAGAEAIKTNTFGLPRMAAARQPDWQALLGDGSQFGIHLSYKVQPSPDGLAQAFLLGEEFIGGDACAMVLGDNIFYGNGFGTLLRSAAKNAVSGKATVFGYYVNDPERFGIVEFDQDGKAVSIEEKPAQPKSNYAVTGLYFYPAGVSEKAKQVKPSARGELEITTLNDMYLQDGDLNVKLLGRGFAWLDTGTMDSLVEAANFVKMIEDRQGITISAPEEIAFINHWITKEKLQESAERYGKSPYGAHLKAVAEGKIRY